ncbi:MAG: DUF1929 domain-containing protein [Pyrinomonadaceae bacterium]|nr:DUF1929 domain-containing protein [Pyrinomonadaceae bacterium]
MLADINEPAFDHRVPGTVIYTRPGTRLIIRVKNDDDTPHSFHVHGLKYGIDSDGAWPFGTQSSDGRRSDEICPGQSWTYFIDVEEYMIGAWPFHDHYRDMGKSINRGLFGGIVVLPAGEHVPRFRLTPPLEEVIRVGLSPEQLAGPRERFGHGPGLAPIALVPALAGLEEDVRAPFLQPIIKPTDTLHVPLFIHVMRGKLHKHEHEDDHDEGPGDGPRIDRGEFVVVPDLRVAVRNLAAAAGLAALGDLVAVRGEEQDKESSPSLCYNGRSFVGNSPTIVGTAGQKIRWYVFNLDLGRDWHNFHPHGERWGYANEGIDVRSLGPAESFVVETVVPQVLLLPPEIEQYQGHDYRPPDAKPFNLRGDFLFHCQSVADTTQGLAGLVRSKQTVWLTPEDANRLRLPLDPGDNSCPEVDFERCANAANGKVEEVANQPPIIFMHAVLLPNTAQVLFWGEGPRPDQTRLWDQDTGLYSAPPNQPADISPDQNIWSGAQGYLNDAAGTILAYGGWGAGPNPGRRAFLFDPRPGVPGGLTFSHATDVNLPRFYSTAISLSDGRIMTIFGTDNNGGAVVPSFEIFTPDGGAGSWSAPEPLPFNYLFYPWTYVLPNGELFIAGPQKPARTLNWTVTPVVDDPARRFNQIFSQRGVNMDGTSVLLPLRPPNYEPRILIAGGDGADTGQSAELIDLSAAAPAWQALPNMNVARDKLNSVLLPDAQVVIVGGFGTGQPDGGPVETFDPEDPGAGFRSGPTLQHVRDYHSAAILLADGSVLVGGDPRVAGVSTPHERYLPPYFFGARPTITGAPTSVGYAAPFTIDTPDAASIQEVVFMRPGSVTHAFNMSQRYVGLEIVSNAGPAVEVISPPNGNVASPGYYLLFIVNGDRVPSTGVWIRLS